MKKVLVLSLAALSSLAVSATGPLSFEGSPKGNVSVVNNLLQPAQLKAKTLLSTRLSKHALLQQSQVGDLKMKNLVLDGIQPLRSNAAPAFKASENASLFESFESWDGEDQSWLPDGWSIESKAADNVNPWGVGQATSWFAGADGNYAAFISYSEEYCDELLISKPVTVNAYEELSFYGMLNPGYMYSFDNFDWDTWEFVGERVVAQSLKVVISEDGGASWTTLVDFADVYKDTDLTELLNMSTWTKYTYSLADYEGKTIQVGFEYYGTDGNTNGIDAVSIDAPALEVSYVYPYSTKYYGISQSLSALPYNIAIEPVFTPITWTNTTDSPSATFTWSYMTPDNDMATSSDRDLTITYHTDFSSAFSTRNNLYYAPTLIGSAPGAADGEYSRCDYFQAGGKAQFQFSDTDGSTYIEQMGMSAFDYNTEGINWLVGDLGATPYFGYSATTDEYWTKYSFPDEDDQVDGNYAYVDGIMNIYLAPDAPLVIDGGWVLAYGSNLDADHEFTLEVIPLTEEGELGTAIGSATIKGSDVAVAVEGTYKNYYSLNFTFDQPVVVSSDICSQYVVRLTGIHECGEWFAPIQSYEDNPDGLYIGVLQKVVSWMNNPQTSLTMTYRLTGARNAFAIMLDATYPWLQGDDEITLEDNSGVLPLNSYYDGSVFTVDAPEWLKVSVAGVNDECQASFTVDGTPTAEDAEVTLSVPGYSKVVTVKGAKDGIASVAVDGNQPVEYYNLQGVRVDATAPGLYIRRQGGNAEKVVIR